MSSCTCEMHYFGMAGTALDKKQSYEDEHLGDLGPYIFGDVDEQIGWFLSTGFLATSNTCIACSQPMDMQTRSDVTDKYRYVCNNSVKYIVPRA